MNRTLKITVMALALLVAASGAMAQTVLKTVLAIGPSSKSPNYTAFLANFQAYLETGVLVAGNPTNNPAVPLVMPTTLLPEYMMESSTAPLWFGTLNPSDSALAGERGNVPYWGVIAMRPQGGLRLADLRLTLMSNDSFNNQPQNSLGAVQRFDTIEYSTRAVGKTGATRITTGPATQAGESVWFTGFGKNYIGNSQADFNNIRAYITGQPTSFTMVARYELLGGDGNPVATAMKQWSVVPYAMVRPRLTARKIGGNVQLTVMGDPKESYTVQSSANPSGPWSDLITVFDPATGFSMINLAPEGRAKFFR